MRILSVATVLVLGMASIAGTINLNDLPNYENQSVPGYITKDNTPTDNPITDEGATLGRVLFYDKNLSVNNTISCGSCHIQEFAFTDTAQRSVGVAGVTGRHAMRLVNARFSNDLTFFWDRRAATLEEQTTQPIQDHGEMGFSGTLGDPDFDSLLRKMEAIEYYPALFEFAFGDDSITEERMQKALAQFVRSIQSYDSKYDAGRALASNDITPFSNFTSQENAGKQLFTDPAVFDPGTGIRIAGGIGCAGCHQPPEFDIDPGTENNAVVFSFTLGTDFGNVRTPSLRDMLDASGNPHSAFMHDGGVTTGPGLEGVIDHYNMIPGILPGMDPRLRVGGNPQNLNMTPAERAELTAFLRTLTGSNLYTDPKWSDPFTGGTLDLILLQCATPESLVADNISSTSARLKWKKVTDALGYRVKGTNLTTGTTASRKIAGPEDTVLLLNGRLDPSTTYVWTVQAGCSATDISELSVADTFTTLTARVAEPLLSIYPNPTPDQLFVTGLPENKKLNIFIYNTDGALVAYKTGQSNGGVMDFNLEKINSGIYTMTILWDDNSTSRKFVKTAG